MLARFARRAVALALAFASLGLAAPAAAQTSCPATQEDWVAWRNAAVDDMLTTSANCADFGGEPRNLCTREQHGTEQYLCRQAVATNGDAILERIASCNPSQEIRDEVLANLIRFSTEVGRQFKPEFSHGYSITDLEYLEYARATTAFPELLASQEFLQKVSDPERYAEALAMIETRNKTVPLKDQWTPLIYEAPFLPSPDCKTYGQFMIRIPGEIDKWIQFGVLTPEHIDDDTELNGVSVVAVRPAEDPDNPGVKNEVMIMDYWRTYENGQVTLQPKIQFVKEPPRSTNCYACHKAPVMPFHPDRTFDFDAAGTMKVQDPGDAKAIIAFLNGQLGQYGPPYFGGYLEPKAFGPGIGPLNRWRSDAFLTRCTAQWPGVDKLRIAELMKCGECHDGNQMGLINFPQAVPSDRDAHSTGGLGARPWATLTFVETFIQLGYMPPDETLTADEKSALSHCLLTEYFDPETRQGLLTEWLHNDVE